jgi:hypothetical protein
MKRILSCFLCWSCCLSAVGIPREEYLAPLFLDNGIELWLKPFSHPSHAISCRVIAKNPFEAVPQIFTLDCLTDDFEDELPYFIDVCKASIINESQCKMSVVAVGDFEIMNLVEFLQSAFEVFSLRMNVPAARMISVNHSDENDMVYLSLRYPTSFQEIKTDQDLKKLWMLYLLQSVVEERFRRTIKETDGQWILASQAKYMLPYANSVVRGKQMVGDEPRKMLVGCLQAMHEIKSTGFSEQELSDAKAKLQKNLANFYQPNPTNSVLADYLASLCAFGAGYPDYSIFMTLSFKAISEIERADVADLIGVYFKDETRHVEMTVPPSINVSEAGILEVLDIHKTDGIVLSLKENVNNSSTDSARELYNKLPLTEEEGRIIYQIIDAVGNWGIPKLYKREDEMAVLGNKVQHVHPFKFLETVLNTPHLKRSMIDIEDGLFNLKWRGFFDGTSQSPGFTAKCEREFARDNLMPYIVGFCQTVKANPEQVRHFVERKEWEKLVRFLIKLEN